MDGPSLITWKYQKRRPESPLEQYGGRRGQRDSLCYVMLSLLKNVSGASGQDGGIGRHTVPPPTTKRRTTTI